MIEKTNHKKASSYKSGLIIIALIAPFLLLIIYYSYQSYHQSQLTEYFKNVDKIQADANSDLNRLNYIFSYFELEPGVAREVLPKFKEASGVCITAKKRLKKINPPKITKNYHQKLIMFYDENSKLCDDLARVSDYINDRNEILLKLSNELEYFNKNVKDAKTDEEALKAGDYLRITAENSIKTLNNLKAPLKIYSSGQLKKNINELSKSLELLSQAINEQNTAKLEESILRFNNLFASDWSNALTETDKKGVKSYQAKIKKIKELQKDLIIERNKIK